MIKKRAHNRHLGQQTTFTYHAAWATLCLLLFTVLAGMWLNTQALNSETKTLKRQLATASQSVCNSKETWQPGTTKRFDIDSGGSKRNYLVHLPNDFSQTKRYPLIMFFPGKGMSAEEGEQLSHFDKLATINVYPSPTPGPSGTLAWQGAPYSSGNDDVTFTNDVLDRVQDQLCVDRERSYAAGFSNGGGFVSLLSCQTSGRFAAYGIVAGALYYPSGGCEPQEPRPLINIHGDHDSVIPYSGSFTRHLPAVEPWIAARARNNQCGTLPSTTYPNGATIITSWQSCKADASVQNVRVKGGEHGWPTLATNLVWNFVSQHSLQSF